MLQSELSHPTNTIPQILIIIIIGWIVLSFASMGIRYIFAMTVLTYQHKDWEYFLMSSMQKMLYLPTDYHIGVQHGEKQKIIDRGAEAVWQAGDNLLLRVIPQIIIAFCLIIMGLTISPMMTLISIILLPVSIIGVAII